MQRRCVANDHHGLQQILAVELVLTLRSESGKSTGHCKGRAEKLGGEQAGWKVRMLMLL